jgi:hypothetical protein
MLKILTYYRLNTKEERFNAKTQRNEGTKGNGFVSSYLCVFVLCFFFVLYQMSRAQCGLLLHDQRVVTVDHFVHNRIPRLRFGERARR